MQTETEVFGSWEGNTRGIASKLMVNMGFLKGGALGKRKQGQLHPIQVAHTLYSGAAERDNTSSAN